MKKILITAFTLLFGSSVLASPAQDIFDEVSYYLVINYGGASSADVRGLPDKYQAQLEATCVGMANTCPAEKAYPVIYAMLQELNDEHTGFYPKLATQIQQLISGNSSQTSVGIGLAILENRVFVKTVANNSAAEQVGIKRGDQITHLNFAVVREKTFNQAWTAINKQGGFITLTRQGQVYRVQLQPSKLEGELPSLQIRPDGIAIIRIPDFFGRGQGTIANQVHALLAQAKNPKGLILELRDNPGGFVSDCTGIAGAFLENASNRFVARTAFGNAEYLYRDAKLFLRRGNVESTVFNVATPSQYTGKVAVLQNAGSASCSEFLASNLQEAKRAKIFGELSAGVSNTSTGFIFLSEQSVLQVSLNTRVDKNNQRYASKVTPDQIVADNLEQINSTGLDAVLESAVAYLNTP